MLRESLRNLPNIGVKLEKKLHEVGIFSLADLKSKSPVAVYESLCEKAGRRLPVCYYLYSLVGAVKDMDWRTLPEFEKKKLIEQLKKKSGVPSRPSNQSDDLKKLYNGFTNQLAANPEMPLDELRRMFEHLGDVTAEPGGVDYLEADTGGVEVMWAVPKGAVQDRVILCIHGGGYVTGSMYSHRKLYGHVAKTVGCRSLIVNYTLVPEQVHPRPVNDCTQAYRWLLQQGIKPNYIALTGDSAGGALAVTTLLLAKEQGLPMPAAIMLLSPWVDLEATGETFQTNLDKDMLISRDVIKEMANTFLGDGGNLRDPLANPLYADLHGLPPIYIQVGGDETLLDDSHKLAKAARRADVAVRLDIEPGMQHVYHFLAGNAQVADKSICKLAVWLRPKLGL